VTEVVTFTDYTPAPRLDDEPWTTVLIFESSAEDGPWTQIDTQDLDPVDSDPSQPASRSFTTDNATLVGGWYQVVFQDADGHQMVFDPIHNVEYPRNQWLPSITDVARLVMSRTKDKYGNEVGTFNSNTRPTNVQVSELITEMADRVTDVIGDEVPEQLWSDAASVVAERTAMEIELSYFPEQVNTNRSAYKDLKEQYEEDITRLGKQVQIVAEGGDLNAISTEPSNKPLGGFPDPCHYPPYGLRTHW
jgi:hypothetical protein